MVAAGSWSSACGNTSASTSRASRTPPVDPARLTTRQPSAAPGDAARQHGGRHAGGDAARPDRLREPRHLAVEDGAVASGVRSVGVRPVPPVVTTRSCRWTGRRADCLDHRVPSGTHDGAVGPRSPPAAGPRRAGPAAVGVHPARGAGRARDDDGARPTARPPPSQPRPVAERPPLAVTRTSVMRACLVDRLDHVDERERRDADGGQRLHLDAGAVGGAHGCGDPTPSSTTSRSTSTAWTATGWRAGPGPGCAWPPGCRRSGRRRARRPWARRRRAGARRPRRSTAARGRMRSPCGRVTALPETSTMCAVPRRVTWVSRVGSSAVIAAPAPAAEGTDAVAGAQPAHVGRHHNESVGARRACRARASPARSMGRRPGRRSVV